MTSIVVSLLRGKGGNFAGEKIWGPLVPEEV